MPSRSLPLKAGGGQFTKKRPFEVSSRSSPGAPGSYQLSVNEGLCSKSLIPRDKLDIIGLSTDEDPAWRTWNGSSDLIWLEIQVSAYAADIGYINSWGSGDDFDIDAEPWTANALVTEVGGDDPVQNSARLMIARIDPKDNGRPKITQFIDTNLVIFQGSINGKIAIFPCPGPGSYI